jgi:type II secretory pathway pseudopilin PulG
MTNETAREVPFSDIVIPSLFVIRDSSPSKARRHVPKRSPMVDHPPSASAFTVLELLIVIAIIITLAGLVLATAGYVQKKGARSRAEAEIAAISAALESYKADNGIYPSNTDTNTLDPTATVDPTSSSYGKSSLYLYEQISGDTDANRVAEAKTYFAFKPNMLLPAPPSTATVTAIRDPFGNSYGYSTEKASDSTKNGYNPTYDLWSTAGGKSTTDVPGWIKNW